MIERVLPNPTEEPTRPYVIWIMAALSFAAFIGAWSAAKAFGIEPVRPDSASYLYFDPSRSIGYPAFLWAVRTLTGNALLAVPIQLALLTGSLFLLAVSFHKLVRRAWLSIPFQLLTLASPEMWLASASLITEAVATTMVALWCAQALCMVRKPSLQGIILLLLASLAATLVRPSLLALFPASALVSLLLLQHRARWLGVAWSAAALALAFAANPAANFLIHGSTATGSPVARGLLQHTLYCAPATSPSDADSAFVEQKAAPVRQYIESAPAAIRSTFKQLYSGELRFGLIIPAIGRRHGFDAGWQTDEILSRIARERIAANPQCYAASALKSYYRLATYQTGGAKKRVKEFKEFVARHPPVPVEAVPLLPNEEVLAKRAARDLGVPEALPGQQSFDPPKEKPWVLMLAARLIFITAALAGVVALLLVLFRKRFDATAQSTIAVMAAAGVAFHGVAAITGLVELPLMRYTVPVWPVVCVLLGLVATWLLGRGSLSEGTRSSVAGTSGSSRS